MLDNCSDIPLIISLLFNILYFGFFRLLCTFKLLTFNFDNIYQNYILLFSNRSDVPAVFSSKQVSFHPLIFTLNPSHTTPPTSRYRCIRRRRSILRLTVMIANPDNLSRVKFLRLLSHQRHIANYFVSLFGEETVVGYTVLFRGRDELMRRTISYYLRQSGDIPGFLIDLGDSYCVAFNRRRRELFVCGFWVPGNFDEGFVDQIRAYIDLIPRDKALPPIPTGINEIESFEHLLTYPDDE